MCKILKISRRNYYRIKKSKSKVIKCSDNCYDEIIKKEYDSSNGNYGSRKISKKLAKNNIFISEYKVLKRMKYIGLSSLYHKRRTKPYSKSNSVTQKYPNIINQIFDGYQKRFALTSDVTYIKVGDKFLYVCFIVDLYNREIISYSIGRQHSSDLILNALNAINLESSAIFHTDCGSEFVNYRVKQVLDSNKVEHSLSKPGCPYDNAVSENLFGILKREWINNKYNNEQMLRIDIQEFVNYYNVFRIHSKLNYMSPIEYRLAAM